MHSTYPGVQRLQQVRDLGGWSGGDFRNNGRPAEMETGVCLEVQRSSGSPLALAADLTFTPVGAAHAQRVCPSALIGWNFNV